jgi:hypothetical protein
MVLAPTRPPTSTVRAQAPAQDCWFPFTARTPSRRRKRQMWQAPGVAAERLPPELESGGGDLNSTPLRRRHLAVVRDRRDQGRIQRFEKARADLADDLLRSETPSLGGVSLPPYDDPGLQEPSQVRDQPRSALTGGFYEIRPRGVGLQPAVHPPPQEGHGRRLGGVPRKTLPPVGRCLAGQVPGLPDKLRAERLSDEPPQQRVHDSNRRPGRRSARATGLACVCGSGAAPRGRCVVPVTTDLMPCRAPGASALATDGSSARSRTTCRSSSSCGQPPTRHPPAPVSCASSTTTGRPPTQRSWPSFFDCGSN